MNEKEHVIKPYLNADEATAALAQQLPKVLELTGRELTEIKHALFYYSECNHGTVGHNMLVIIAKMAIDRGFGLNITDGIPCFEITLPDGVEIVSK